MHKASLMNNIVNNNGKWFSFKNKEFFEDLEYDCYETEEKRYFLLQRSYCFSGSMINKDDKKAVWRIHTVTKDYKIDRLLDEYFDTKEGAIEFIKKYSQGLKDKFYEVVFLQGEEATKPLEILANEGEQKALEYLCKWDYGDYGEELIDDTLSGKEDIKYENNYYVMVYNTKLGCIGLIRKITEV